MDWWHRILFPGTGERPEQAGTGWSLAFLTMAAGLLFFGRLGCPLQEPQEPRYAEIARQMLVEGCWLVPVFHGQPYYDKPPLLYWLVMASYQVFGVHDWAARLVPSTAGFFSVLVTWWWGRRAVGPRTAWLGALILCLSPRFVQLGRLVLMDGPLCLCVVSAWATAHVALRGPTRNLPLWLASAAACGLGLLVKGPVALVLALAPVLVYPLLDARAVRPSWRLVALYLLVALGVATPWFLLVALRDPDFLGYFFWFHHVKRFVTPFDHEEPFWYYLPVLLLGMLPWTLLLPGLFCQLCSQSRRSAACRPAGLGYFLLAFVAALSFFSAAGCKRPAYILVAMPPLALALATYVNALLPRRLGLSALLLHSSSLGYRLTLAALLLGLAGALGSAVSGIIDWQTGGWLAGLAGAGLLLLWRLPRRALPWAAPGLAAFLVMLLAVHQVLPGYSRRFAYRGTVRSQEPADLPVACYPRRWESVSFYLQRNDVAEYADPDHLVRDLHCRPATLLFVKPGQRGAALDDLLRRLPPTLEFVPQGRQGSLAAGVVRRK